ncbi:unnamed protein product, partial [Meganyctiphanes norvegica]
MLIAPVQFVLFFVTMLPANEKILSEGVDVAGIYDVDDSGIINANLYVAQNCPYPCEKPYYPVCGGDRINYKTFGNLCFFHMKVDCYPQYAEYTLQHNGTCACILQRVIGPCLAIVPSYYYDIDMGRCVFFEYGGCEGNTNR